MCRSCASLHSRSDANHSVLSVPTLDLTNDEREALIRYLRDGIERDRFPLSPRLEPIRAILAKLEPPPTPPGPPAERKAIVPPRASRKRSRW